MTPLRARWCWMALVLLSVVARFYLLTNDPLDWDAAQFNLGTREYSVEQHQPHPPGYPLWVFSIRLLAPLTGGPGLAQQVLALAFAAAALFVFYRAARQWLSSEGALGASILLAVSPLVQLNAFSQATYTVEMLASALVGWLGWRAWQGETRVLLPLFAVLPLCAGFRPSMLMFLSPVVAVSALRAVRNRPLAVVPPLLIGGAVLLAWSVPAASIIGGFAKWSALNRLQMWVSIQDTSMFAGALPWRHVNLALEATTWLLVGLAGMVAAAVSSPRKPSLGWERLLFLALWVAPSLTFIYFIHFSRPGYLLLSLLPLSLFTASCCDWRRPRAVWTGLAVIGIGLLVDPSWFKVWPLSIGAQVAARGRPEILQQSIAATRIMHRLVAEEKPDAIVSTRPGAEAPNCRTLLWEYPNLPIHREPIPIPVTGKVLWIAGESEKIPGKLLHSAPNLRIYRVPAQ